MLGRAVAKELIKAMGVKPIQPLGKLKLGADYLLSLDMGAAAKHFKVPRNTIAQRTRKQAVTERQSTQQNALWEEAYA